MDLEIASAHKGDACLVTLSGEVDVYTAPALRERLVEDIEGGCPMVVIDMSGVDFIDSSGLGVLVSALKRVSEAGITMRIVCDSEPVLKIFRITGLDKVFDLVPSLDEAIEV
jgi:anti-sigma B factor antagonist